MDSKALAAEQASVIINSLEYEFRQQVPETVQVAQQRLINSTAHAAHLKTLLAETQAEVIKLCNMLNNYDEHYAKAKQEHQKKVDAIKRLEYAVFIPESSKRSRREMSNWCRKQTKSKKNGEWTVNDVVTGFRTPDPTHRYGFAWHNSMLGAGVSGTVYFFADKQVAMLFKLTFI